MPYFNAPIYLENKTQIGKVEEILGAINNVVRTQCGTRAHTRAARAAARARAPRPAAWCAAAPEPRLAAAAACVEAAPPAAL